MREAKSYIDTRLKPAKAFFDWCLSQIPVYKWENKEKMILSSERQGSKVIEKRLTKVSNLDFNAGFYPFTIVLVTAKRIEIQTYCYWVQIINGKESIETELTNLELLANDQHIQIGHYSYMNEYGFGLVSIGIMGGKYTGTRLYKNNWEERVQTISELRYLNLSEVEYMSFGNLPHLYKFKFEIEYLQKIRATTIAREVANNYQIDFRTITKKWLRVNKQLLKNNKDPFYVFELKRRVLERGGKVVPGIEKYMNYRDVNSISKCVGIVSFQNWVIKNKVDMQFYRDYLGMLKDLNIKVDNQNLVKPKDLKKAHDNVVKLMNEMNVARGDADIGKRLKSTMKLEKDIDDYVFLVPKSLNELIVEGKSLHHCVGSSTYVEGHRKGQTTIVFVREKEYPNTPFFTLEFKNGQINQLRGKHNKAASKEVKQATERWLEWTNKNRRTAKKRSTRKTEFV
ncbi:PcfJ domain-containing protein [Carnobacterium maltaromaticum]|uniref:PcfJ domain-containing protein n=1 Tax=Carnobacterium maltaromaticum TaxID=2751 RepID=UPI001071A1B2|nr:PcfJ domain-containing protein [Carnobacterium maltaromaticum]TFJ76285.1 hypothetical protein CKN94_02645 [Carnobacterium maltaromaticum]TFJ79085.1 hypothetical protein CKN97_02640 [Carnobacterium maltaromaticum]